MIWNAGRMKFQTFGTMKQMAAVTPVFKFVYKFADFPVVLSPAAMIKWRCEQKVKGQSVNTKSIVN